MDAKKRYEDWLENPYFDENTKNELRRIADDEKEIEERCLATSRQTGIIERTPNTHPTPSCSPLSWTVKNLLCKTKR